MDAPLREDVELLYSLLIRRFVYVDAMHGMRLHEPGQYCENPDFDRKRFWERFDGLKGSYAVLMKEVEESHAAAKRIVERREINEAIYLTIAKQSVAFKPESDRTFCGEAMDELWHLFFFFHKLLNRMQMVHRDDAGMVDIFRNLESLWNEYGFRKGDYDELQRGLAWELATVLDMQRSHFAMERIAELLSEANAKGRKSDSPKTSAGDSTKERGKKRGKTGVETGAAQPKLAAAFVLHHQYENGSIGNYSPLSIRKLAELADTSNDSSKRFIDHWFEGIKEYKRDVAKDNAKLRLVLMQLQNESVIRAIKSYGRAPDSYDAYDD